MAIEQAKGGWKERVEKEIAWTPPTLWVPFLWWQWLNDSLWRDKVSKPVANKLTFHIGISGTITYNYFGVSKLRLMSHVHEITTLKYIQYLNVCILHMWKRIFCIYHIYLSTLCYCWWFRNPAHILRCINLWKKSYQPHLVIYIAGFLPKNP